MDDSTLKPLISFCISTFNRETFLREQIQLLLKQTFTDFDIVISDNDPQGSALKAVEKFNNPKIKYFSNKE